MLEALLLTLKKVDVRHSNGPMVHILQLMLTFNQLNIHVQPTITLFRITLEVQMDHSMYPSTEN